MFAQQFDFQFGLSSSHVKEKVKEKVNPQPVINATLVTGDGLLTSGSGSHVARGELKNIHEENNKVLESLTDSEIKEEQEKMKKILGK